ncbi:hypothetical protein GCM10010232_46470 [Streptomyces amakusaensis]
METVKIAGGLPPLDILERGYRVPVGHLVRVADRGCCAGYRIRAWTISVPRFSGSGASRTRASVSRKP